MHPELGFQEVRTARIVAEQLSALGYEFDKAVPGERATHVFVRRRA